MMAGTYILTDTIKPAFGESSPSVYKRTDVVDHAARARSAAAKNTTSRPRPPIAERCSRRCARCPGSRRRRAAIFDQAAARRTQRQGDLERRRARPRVQLDPHGDQRFNPLQARRRRAGRAGRSEVAIDADTAERQRLRGRPDDRRRRRAARCRRFTIVGIAKFGGVASLGGATIADLRPRRRRSALLRQAGPARQDRRRRQGRRHAAAAASREIRPLLPPDAPGAHRRRQAEQSTPRTPTRSSASSGLPARLRRHRAVRRRLHHLNTLSITVAQRTREFAHAAHARRDAPAGAALGAARGAR